MGANLPIHRCYQLMNKLTYLNIKSNSCSVVAYISAALMYSPYSFSTESVVFNSEFLRSDVDISKFSEGNPVPPGDYPVDIYVNDKWVDSTVIKFTKVENSNTASPCFNLSQISNLGVNVDKIKLSKIDTLKEYCRPISALLTDTESDYDSANQRLNVKIPQAYLLRQARGYVSPKLWDNGITSATLEYDYNGYRSETSGTSNLSTQYLGLKGGLNLGAWRLRYRGTLNWATGSKWSYDNNSTYIEHGLNSLKSKMVVGESNTDGQVFNSVGFRGAMITSDDRMYMDSQRGFAPIINGVADTNAVVTVSQLGSRIYETTVPPGPFIIDDLYPTGSGGDLVVTVKEADGRQRSFTVSYASIAELLRPGTTRYTLMSGRYHNSSVSEDPLIAMGTLRHGFTNYLTGFSGILAGEYYKSISAGIALNTPLGAISTDVTHARSNLDNNNYSEGQSIGFSYAKIVPLTDTHITLASYRYSSSGFYNINDAMLLRDLNNTYSSSYYSTSLNRKSRTQISANQIISDALGSVNLSASTQTYWNKNGSDTEYQIGYTNRFKYFNVNLNASRTRDLARNEWDTKFAIGISLPLGNSASSMYLNSTYVQERDHYGIQNSIAGVSGSRRQYNYSGFANADHYDNSGSKQSGGVSGNWNSQYTNVGGSYSAGSGYKQYGVTMSGGVIGYSQGVVFTPIMGDTMAIIEADNASGAVVTNNSSLTLDNSGKAAVPYLTPYRQNVVEIDPKGLSTDISVDVTSQHSVPTAGAVVLLKYKTEQGYSVVLNIIDKTGKEIPFGAEIKDEQNNNVGYIAQGKQAFIRVKNLKGDLTVSWGNKNTNSCKMSYDFSSKALVRVDGLRYADMVCK